MGSVQKKVGYLRGVGLLTSGLVLGSLLAPSAASAQLYGAGRNNSAVVIDEDVLGSLGGGAPRPGVGVGYLPAPAAPPRSKINQVPPPKAKAAPPVPVVATQRPAPAVPTPEVSNPPAAPLAAQPQAPKPDPGPPPVPAQPPAPVEPAPAPKAVAIAAPAAPPTPPPVATPVVAVPSPVLSEKGVRLLFLPDSADIPTTARPTLESIVKLVQSQPERRILITAYAAGTPETASQSRRLSLNRALTVRSFLAEQGVSTARVDVRALGGLVTDGPADRVDLELTTP